MCNDAEDYVTLSALRKAEAALTKIDRICTQRLLGELTDEQSVVQITEVIGAWTDPDAGSVCCSHSHCTTYTKDPSGLCNGHR